MKGSKDQEKKAWPSKQKQNVVQSFWKERARQKRTWPSPAMGERGLVKKNVVQSFSSGKGARPKQKTWPSPLQGEGAG